MEELQLEHTTSNITIVPCYSPEQQIIQVLRSILSEIRGLREDLAAERRNQDK